MGASRSAANQGRACPANGAQSVEDSGRPRGSHGGLRRCCSRGGLLHGVATFPIPRFPREFSRNSHPVSHDSQWGSRTKATAKAVAKPTNEGPFPYPSSRRCTVRQEPARGSRTRRVTRRSVCPSARWRSTRVRPPRDTPSKDTLVVVAGQTKAQGEALRTPSELRAGISLGSVGSRNRPKRGRQALAGKRSPLESPRANGGPFLQGLGQRGHAEVVSESACNCATEGGEGAFPSAFGS